MIDGFPLSFFLPLVVHVLAGLTTGVTGMVAFRAPKRRGRHHRWGRYYLWAYSVVFFTATILSVQRWAADAYLFFLALAGFGLALSGYGARRFRREPSLARLFGKQWVVAHIVGMIGSYIVLWTAFYVDNAHLIPGLNQLPPLTFWVLPTLIGIPFIVVSISHFVPNRGAPSSQSPSERNTVNEEAGDGLSSREEEKV
jgi:4-hydroxybenzoate polyprenyltransferase